MESRDKMEIWVKFIGLDKKGREVFTNIHIAHTYKRNVGEDTFYAGENEFGDLCVPVKDGVKVTIVTE